MIGLEVVAKTLVDCDSLVVDNIESCRLYLDTVHRFHFDSKFETCLCSVSAVACSLPDVEGRQIPIESYRTEKVLYLAG